jgi:hypothetical protein
MAKKQQVRDAVPVKNPRRALKSGPHSKVITTSGESDATPNPHRATDGGQKGGMKGL